MVQLTKGSGNHRLVRVAPSVDYTVAPLIEEFGNHLASLIARLKPDYLVPLETKGAILLELAFGALQRQRAVVPPILYPKAFRYYQPDTLHRRSALIVDDVLFSGRSLADARAELLRNGMRSTNIYMTALLDFASGKRGVDYLGDIHDAVSALKGQHTAITRDDALQFLQQEITMRRMPSTYDLVVLEAKEISQRQYEGLLYELAPTERLLSYGRRGGFLTATILLDDLHEHGSDLPPKVRMWYSPDRRLLRVAPVGASNVPAGDEQTRQTHERLAELLVTRLAREEDQPNGAFEARLLAARLQLLALVKPYLEDARIGVVIEPTHLRRYYPTVAKEVTTAIRQYFATYKPQRLQRREGTTESWFTYLQPAREIIATLKALYEQQGKGATARVDFRSRGLTGRELLRRLKYPAEHVHAAIDYCFDLHYVTAFTDTRNGKLVRSIRTTEIAIAGQAHHADVYGAAIIHARREVTPAWLLSKVYPILENTQAAVFDRIVVKKGPFGDFSKVAMSEEGELYWRDIQSDYWTVEHRRDDEQVLFVARKDKYSEGRALLRDPRIAAHRTPLEATLFLCTQGSRDGAILLDILTGNRGGTDYLAHNLEQIITLLSHRPDRQRNHYLQQHQKGFKEKLRLIEQLYGQNHLIERLQQRCTRLEATPLTQVEAENIVHAARWFEDPRLYQAFKAFGEMIIAATDACLRSNTDDLRRALHPLHLRNTTGETTATVMRNAHEELTNWLYALGMRDCHDRHYQAAVYRAGDITGVPPYVLAYDLTSARTEHAMSQGITPETVNHALTTLAQNWIIALGGRLSKAEINSGDLRYGYFRTLEDAVQAAAWIIHQSRQLVGIHPHIPTRDAYGIAITRGNVHADETGNLSSRSMDYAGHYLKEKVKQVHDEVAGEAGRQGKHLPKSPIYLLFYGEFHADPERPLPLGAEVRYQESDDVLRMRPLDIAAYLATRSTPWAHTGSKGAT